MTKSNLSIEPKKINTGRGFVLWLTGLSAAGKSTIADEIYRILADNGKKIKMLDGDKARENLTKDLGFSKEDRDENIRRVGSKADSLCGEGVIVLASFITPYRQQRDELRRLLTDFIEVFVDAPVEVCEQRDPKGLYKKARRGEINNFTGISDPYERPENPDIHLKTDEMSIKECVKIIVNELVERQFIKQRKMNALVK